jgi:hypothetical protein
MNQKTFTTYENFNTANAAYKKKEGGVRMLIWIFPIFFTKEKRGIHEIITSTRVCLKTDR